MVTEEQAENTWTGALFGHPSGTRMWSSLMADVDWQRPQELFAQY